MTDFNEKIRNINNKGTWNITKQVKFEKKVNDHATYHKKLINELASLLLFYKTKVLYLVSITLMMMLLIIIWFFDHCIDS